jgi:hypothetical protein
MFFRDGSEKGRSVKAELRWIASILTGCVAVSTAAPSHALCVYEDHLYAKTTLAQEFHDADLVIRGRVTSLRYFPGIDKSDTDPLDQDIVESIQVFKGKSPPKVVYYTAHNSGGFYLDRGKDYLFFLTPTPVGLFGRGEPAGFQINYSCGQSKPWSEVSASDISALKALVVAKPSPVAKATFVFKDGDATPTAYLRAADGRVFELSLAYDGGIGLRQLTLFRPGHKPAATNLLEPAHNWHGLEAFHIQAIRETLAPDGSLLYGRQRDIPVRNYPFVLHVDLVDYETVDVHDDTLLGDQAFKKLVLTAELRRAK